MKPIKVFFMGKRLKDIYPHATRFQVFKYRVRMFVRKIVLGSIALATLLGAVQIGANYFPSTVYAVQEKVVEVTSPAAIMDKIAKCESESRHFAKNGQVVVNANSNGSVDIGTYQINLTVWGKKATELGYNLATEEGNKAMAYWLYANRGTEPWYATKACWSK